MTYSYLLRATFASSLVLLLGCDQGSTPIGGFDDDGCVGNDDDPPDETTDFRFIVVDCSFDYAGAGQVLRFEAGVELEPVVLGGSLSVSATVFDDMERSFSISVFDEAGTVSNTALYQIESGRLPVNEFLGQHGFTGLNYVRDPSTGETAQYACFARSPDDPIQGWDE